MDIRNRVSKARRNIAGKISRFLDTINNISILRGEELEIPDASIPDYWRAWLDEVRAWEKVAVLAGHRSYTYRALDQESDRILTVCRQKWQMKTVIDDCVIALFIPPSFERIAALMAILKMGCAYMPLEESLPTARISLMVGEAEVKYILTTSELAKTFADEDFLDLQLNILSYAEIKDLYVEPKEDEVKDEEVPEEKKTDVDNVNEIKTNGTSSNLNKLVSVVYTSGSTGISKGVKLRTGNIMNRLFWYWKTFPFGENEVGCHKTSFLFIDSLTEILACVLHGVPLVVLSSEKAQNPCQLLKSINEHKVSRLVLVPSLLHSMLDICEMENSFDLLQHLELVISSGEPLPVNLAHRFFAHAPGACVLANFYGSTETTGDVFAKVYFNDGDVDYFQIDNSLCVGAPISNTNVVILNREEEPVREGELGMIYISGQNVADGYVRSGSDTLFIDNKFDNRPGHEFLFNTGDIGLVKDGKLFLFGRADDIMKIRGHRVNMLEIEKVVDKIKSIQRRVIIPCHVGDQTMPVCFCQLEKDSNTNKEDIIQILRGVLPAFMVPRVFIIEEFPSQPSTGKIDRQALKEIFYLKHANSQSIKDVSVWESILNTIVRNLGISQSDIKSDDNFIALGGNSLSAVSTIVELKRMGYCVSLEHFLQVSDFPKFCKDLASKRNYKKKPTVGISTDIENYKLEQVTSLHDDDSKKTIQLLATEFSRKNPLDILAGSSPQQVERLVMSIWNEVLHDDLSFVVRDVAKGKIVAVTILLDANTNINPEFVMYHVGAINDEVERPVKERLLREGGHWADSILNAVDSGVAGDEALIILQFMEEEVLRVAERRGYDGIVTVNSHPVTMAMDEHYFGYSVENEIQVKEWQYQGKTPFDKADEDYVIKAMVKRLT